jgi:hypothetical protein
VVSISGTAHVRLYLRPRDSDDRDDRDDSDDNGVSVPQAKVSLATRDKATSPRPRIIIIIINVVI